MPYAKVDDISLVFGASGAAAGIFVVLAGGTYAFDGIVAVLLILTGMAFGSALGVQQRAEIPHTEKEESNIGSYAIAALGVFIVFSYILNQITYTASTKAISISTFFGAVSFPQNATFAIGTGGLVASGFVLGLVFIGVVMPIVEEFFFRGLWGNFAIRAVGIEAGAAAAGVIFMLFHLPVDGANPYVLGSILVDGATIMAIDIATGRLITGIIAHIANNLLSYSVQGSVLSALGAPPFSFPVTLVLPLAQMTVPLFVFGLLVYKKGVKLR